MKLILYPLSQSLDQNNNDTTNFILSVKTIFALSYLIIISFEII